MLKTPPRATFSPYLSISLSNSRQALPCLSEATYLLSLLSNSRQALPCLSKATYLPSLHSSIDLFKHFTPMHLNIFLRFDTNFYLLATHTEHSNFYTFINHQALLWLTR